MKRVIPRSLQPDIIRSRGLPACTWNCGTHIDDLNAAMFIGLAASIPIVVETAVREMVSLFCDS